MYPCRSGISAPPEIAMISREEPWLVYFPSPAMASANIAGHMMELYNPRLITDHIAKSPEVNRARISHKIQITENSSKVFTGFSGPRKNALILTIMNGM